MTSDDTLRARLEAADPASDQHAPDLLDRLDLAESSPAVGRLRGRSWILAAAAVAVMVLFGAAVVPNLFSGGSTSDSAAVQSEDRTVEGASVAQSADAEAAEEPVYPGGPSIVRTASLTVGAEDPVEAADTYVTRVTAMGGQVTSRTEATEGSPDMPMSMMDGETMMPERHAGPGVWLTVEVPVARFDEALAAAQDSGQIVRTEQSAQDVSATVADTDARVQALRDSVAQLRSLMDQATSISEVIALEDAIAARQSELDGLLAQQRELRSSLAMSRISMALMSPEDAAAVVGERPPDQWAPARWAIGLTLIAGLIILVVVVTRRRRRTQGGVVPSGE